MSTDYNFYDNINFDIDILYRQNIKQNEKTINLNNVLNEDFLINNYDTNKQYLIEKYQNINIED